MNFRLRRKKSLRKELYNILAVTVCGAMFIPVFIARTNTITIAECTESYSLQRSVFYTLQHMQANGRDKL